MRGSGVLLAALAIIPQAICQASLSSTSVVTCITTLGTTSVVPLPTTTNLRSLTIDSIQPSTFTPTATSTPPDTTTTLTYTQFPTTTTTLINTEIDTFSTTTTLVSALLITNTMTITVVNIVTQTSTNTAPTTVSTYPGFVPAASAQASQLAVAGYESEYYPNKRRSFDSRSLPRGSYGGAIGVRQVSAAAAVLSGVSSNTASPSEYTYPNAVSCTGIVEYFSVTTKVVSTAPAVTTTLMPVTDTTSTTETIIITSSVLSAPASTTETISTTITTSSLAGTFTSTVLQTSTTTVTVLDPQSTVYPACGSDNLVSTIKDTEYPINYLGAGELGDYINYGITVVTNASTAYACCVQGVSGFYTDNGGGAAYLASTGQCFLFPAYGADDCDPTTPFFPYSYCGSSTQGQYTVSSGDCGEAVLERPCK